MGAIGMMFTVTQMLIAVGAAVLLAAWIVVWIVYVLYWLLTGQKPRR